jgi:cytochrome P450
LQFSSTIEQFVSAGLEDLNKKSDDFKADLTSRSIFQNFLLTREKYGLTMDDVVALTGDFVIAGVDTTSAALGFILYELGRDQSIQDILYNELSQNLKKGEFITEEKLAKLPFLKAVLKETLR